MKCLITGISGYTGSRLAEYAAEKGASVLGLVHETAPRRSLPASVALAKLPSDDAALFELVAASKPDVIFHLAGRHLGARELWSPAANVDANFALGVRLASAVAAASPYARLVNVRSYWEFGDTTNPRPLTAYAALRRALAGYLADFSNLAGVAHMSVVLFDTYGPGDWRSKLVPAMLECVRSGGRLELTPGDQELDLVHVDDVCAGLWTAATDGFEQSETRSLGGGARTSVRSLAGLLLALCSAGEGPPADFVFGAKPYPLHQIHFPVADLRNVLGWSPRVSLEFGLRQCLREKSPRRTPWPHRS